MEKEKLVFRKGTFQSDLDSSYPPSESFDSIRNLLTTIQEYRDYFQPNQTAWKEYIQDIFHVFKFSPNSIFPKVYLMGNIDSENTNYAVQAIISPQDNFEEIDKGISWGKFLFYVASFYKVRYGIVTNGLKVIIFDFQNGDYLDSYFLINLEGVIQGGLEDSFFKLANVFNRIKGQPISKSGLKSKRQRRSLKSRQVSSGSYDLNYHLNRSQEYTKNLFESLRKKIFMLSDSINERYNKMYVTYSITNNFCEIHFQTRRLKIWVNACIEEIEDPLKLCRDMRGIGHYGTGESELFLENFDDLENVFAIIEQSCKINVEKYGIGLENNQKENKMNKYHGLFVHLSGLPSTQSSVTLRFKEIEEIIGEDLPDSAIKYRPWWANEKGGTHSQRLAWMEAGWLVDKVDLKNEIVTFRRE